LARFLWDIKEAILTDAPTPLGGEVDLLPHMDSDYAGDKLACCLQLEYFIYMNGATIMWLLHKQMTIETSVFGVEFVAMKQGMEAKYKLHMLGIPISGPLYLYGTICWLSITCSILSQC
jgi:hypothetical protein